MMRIKTLAELATSDPMSLRFTPHGLGMNLTMKPEAAAEFQQVCIAAYDLHPDVPDSTRNSFERLRKLHSHGVLLYDAFTVAADLAWLVLDQALRERFVTFYNGAIPFQNQRTGEEQVLRVNDFNEVFDAFRGELKDRDWALRVKTTEQLMKFRGGLSHLLSWARNEELLHGQKNKSVEFVYAEIRNLVAHANYRVTTPVDSARTINDIREIINRLWGHLTPKGRLYPTPRERDVLIVGWVDSESGLTFEQFPMSAFAETECEGNWTFLVVRGVAEEDLWEFDAEYERTKFPSELLWGPGSKEHAIAWLEAEQPLGDTADFMDRLFAVRINDGRVSLARRPDIALALPEERRTGRWLLIRADFPSDAFAHVRHVKNGVSCTDGVPRESCSVEPIFDGDWQGLANELQVKFDISRATLVSSVRIPRRFGSAPDVEEE